jgi:hypothetical protein
VSFYTAVERFYLDEAGVFDVAALSGRIDALLDRLGFHEDVAAGVKRLLADGRADFGLGSWAVIELIAEIAALTPERAFAVRGRGEDPRMVWVREYENGRELFAFGPPDGAEA